MPFEIIVSDIDESYPANLSIEQVPVFIAKNKAEAVKQKMIVEQMDTKDTCIIAADTVVVLADAIIGKPIDKRDAINSLSKLSGKAHQVITGVVILFQDQEVAFSETTQVEFHDLTQAQIEFYVDQYKPYDKAGAYAIQEWIGVVGIKSIHGDFYNVMGLPVSKLIQKLKQLNIL